MANALEPQRIDTPRMAGRGALWLAVVLLVAVALAVINQPIADATSGQPPPGAPAVTSTPPKAHPQPQPANANPQPPGPPTQVVGPKEASQQSASTAPGRSDSGGMNGRDRPGGRKD